MASICPTITAANPHIYREQIERVAGFAKRLHIDLMDGVFAPSKSLAIEQVWWPESLQADIHLMYQHPRAQLPALIKLQPQTVIVPAECQDDVLAIAEQLHAAGIGCGLALLPETPVSQVSQLLSHVDQVMIFSGHLGYQGGGQVDLALLSKVAAVKQQRPDLLCSWDGGVTADTAGQLVRAGIEVLNVGSFIQLAADPAAAYQSLVAAID